MFRILNQNKRKKKGQSTMEFTVLIIIVIGALIATQQYIKRAVQGSLFSAANDISEEQFSPGNTNMTRRTQSGSTTTEVMKGGATNTITTGSSTNTSVSMNLINAKYEYWGTTNN